uniref:Uncharacterized protein n=1 Tax=Anguilla anguilla TaxID=7936 RepID=A0A0E9Q432_ANGAN
MHTYTPTDTHTHSLILYPQLSGGIYYLTADRGHTFV